ncbi:hypothetical protein AVEN_108236-1 [Araneus ventricosus]|uniref:Uncharacterized protein n=1 Tax=Araneus ventricosus TaxID=182803 RepID=A0A4Y2DVJ6_ARAVE|nr:hypothetical protein AVEN_108236-1 [Araneus ventricosus]
MLLSGDDSGGGMGTQCLERYWSAPWNLLDLEGESVNEEGSLQLREDILQSLESRGFEIVFCWIPIHVGIPGNEKADNAARLGSAPLEHAVPYSDMCQIAQQKVTNKWQELWNEQIHNKLHNVKPVLANWPTLPYRKADATLTRLRIGHTRYTHRCLLFQEPIPMCTSCNIPNTVDHILTKCPSFNSHRLRFFNSNFLDLRTLLGEKPHPNLFAFLRNIGFISQI